MSPEHVDVALTRNAMEHFLNVYQEFAKVHSCRDCENILYKSLLDFHVIIKYILIL